MHRKCGSADPAGGRRPAGLIGCPEPLAVFAASCLVSLSRWRDPGASPGDRSDVEVALEANVTPEEIWCR